MKRIRTCNWRFIPLVVSKETVKRKRSEDKNETKTCHVHVNRMVVSFSSFIIFFLSPLNCRVYVFFQFFFFLFSVLHFCHFIFICRCVRYRSLWSFETMRIRCHWTLDAYNYYRQTTEHAILSSSVLPPYLLVSRVNESTLKQLSHQWAFVMNSLFNTISKKKT